MKERGREKISPRKIDRIGTIFLKLFRVDAE